MNMPWKVFLLAILIMITSINAAAQFPKFWESKPQDLIIGTWKSDDNQITLTFRSDGVIDVIDQGNSLSLDYSIIDNRFVKTKVKGAAGIFQRAYEFFSSKEVSMEIISISKNEMVLRKGGEDKNFKRVN